MRLFVALAPPEEVRTHLATALAAVPALMASGRPARTEQWHLTLAFLADVEPEKEPDVERAAGFAARSTRPLGLRLSGVGSFRGGRAVGVGLAGDLDLLQRMTRTLNRGLRSARLSVDRKPFRPHLTLARSVDIRIPAVAAALDVLSTYESPQWTAGEILLVHSRLGAGPHGSARHDTIGAYRLGDISST